MWWMNFSLWENTLVPRRIKSAEERIWLAHRAVIARWYVGKCVIILVDFKGGAYVKALPKPETPTFLPAILSLASLSISCA